MSLNAPAAPAAAIQLPRQGLRPEHPWALLAGLRFLLALIVLGSHAPVGGFHCAPLEWLAKLGPQQAIVAFFLISGYSIGHSVEKEPVGYARRRAFRIYPVYLTCLAVGMLPYLWCRDGWVQVGNGPIGLVPISQSLLPCLLLVQCLGWPAVGVLGSAWSLSIEWLFYLAAPLLARLHAAWLWLLVAVSASCMLVYPHVPAFSGTPYRDLAYGLSVLIAGWAWLAGFLLHRGRGDAWVKLAIPAVAACVSLASADPWFVKQGVLIIAIAALTIGFGNRVAVPTKLAGVLGALGDLSYPLYLVHLPVYIILYSRFHATSWAVYLGATFGLSWVILYAVDRPLRTLGRLGTASQHPGAAEAKRRNRLARLLRAGA